jgi:hypothetical protein
VRTHEDFNGSRIAQVGFDRIDVPTYQRPLIESWADYMHREWNHALFRFPTVNKKPNNRYDVLDGRHTIEGATRRGREGCPMIVMEVSEGDAAIVFASINTQRKRLSPFQIFVAERYGGEPSAVAFDKIVRGAGLTVAPITSADTFACVAEGRALIRRRNGHVLLRDTLAVLTEVWDAGHPSRVERSMVSGIASVIDRLGGEFNRADLVKRLSRPTTFDVAGSRGIHLTPENIQTYIRSLVERGKMRQPAMNSGAGQASNHGFAFATAAFGYGRARQLYPGY